MRRFVYGQGEKVVNLTRDRAKKSRFKFFMGGGKEKGTGELCN